ncbi:MAG: permease for cytosine/purines, uracil, thiamine, allantoin-domain-containing protein [Podila humilis]|nr:MAG: permease for cytosine/purines, uracil, thiamine, allantoin-domain-containing protein [Podila humilis]
MGVELRGIERVMPEDRQPKGVINNLLMWWSVNCVLTTVPIGTLGPAVFGMGLRDTILSIVGFTILGCFTTAFCATLGPKLGLRQMVISRFSFGWWGAVFLSLLNIITQIGFSVIAVILGGQTLVYVCGEKLPLDVAIIIVSVVTLLICFFGYDLVHKWERYAWILISIIMCILYGTGHEYYSWTPSTSSGADLAGSVLSFGGVVFGSVIGWAPIAADYNVMLPEDTSAWKVFWLTFLGLFIPLVFVESLGALYGTALINNPAWETIYQDGEAGLGSVLGTSLSSLGGFGKFLVFLLALSVVSNNVPNTYSAALSIQTLGKPFQRVPRFIWTILVAVAYTVAGVAGKANLSAILNNFLSILSYWTTPFVVVLALEHFVFRRRTGYNVNDYGDQSKLPWGLAAGAAGVIGVVGAVLGMNQTWYIGPVGKLTGTYGGDLGFEMALVLTSVAYLALRPMELRYVGR